MMTSPIGARINKRLQALGRNQGFTLIELILVMGLLTVVVTAAAPSLGRFFRGHAMDNEARRFLALAHYAQSQAISLAVPMRLWIDREQKTYGLNQAIGYSQDAVEEIEIAIDEEITIEILPTGATQSGLAEIAFYPDGTFDLGEIQAIAFGRENEESIYIAKSLVGMELKIVKEENRNEFVLTTINL